MEERDWSAAGQKGTFGFARALDRDLLMNEVRRLLPASLVRFASESSQCFAKVSPLSERLPSR